MTLAPQAKTEELQSALAHPALVGGAIGVAYLLAGFLGPWVQAQPDRAITPAAGVALAALLIFGIRHGVIVWIAAIVLCLWNGMPFFAAALTGAVLALEAMMGALLLQGTGCRLLLDRVRDVASFGVLGVLASPAFGAFVGGPVLLLTGQIAPEALGSTIMRWWLSDAVGILLVAPVILAVVVGRSREGWPRWWPLEGGLGLASTALVAVALFGGRAPDELAQAALLVPLPFLLWGIFRFGLHGAAFIMATVAGVVVWSSAAGAGPFAAGVGTGNVELWIYLITLGFVGLVTWSLVAEHRTALLRFEAVFDNSSEGIIILHHGRVAHCNPAAVQLFGTRAAERLIDRDADQLSPLEQPDGSRSSEALRAHMNEADRRKGKRFEWTLERQDGTTFPAEISLSRVVVGGSPGYLAVIRDMSDQKARREALEAARDEALAANKAKTTYLTEVSHKIRTALNTNLGFARMIARDESLPAKHRGYVQKVLTSGKDLLELVDDVLERSRIEADRLGASVAIAFDLGRLLTGVAETFRVRAEEKGISVDLDVDDGVPARVVGEQGRLEQVLTVLVGNAVKATSDGRVSVAASRGEGGDDPEAMLLVIDVSDTGPGLTPEEIDELFRRTDEPGAAPSGNRLGLPEAREAARDMGGDLTVESEPGEGARFRLTVVTREPGPEDQEGQGPRRVTRLAEGQKAPRILIVDDTEENRTLLQGLLTRVGFLTRTAADGREAIQAFGSWEPDLILMDQKMPTMDGTEATRRIKASERGRGVPIIMVTAAGFGVNREEIMAGGADGFVRVPFHETELLREIERHLDVRYDREE